jgi:uncharacterized membrane protein
MESKTRSILKTLSWRVWATVITFFVVLYATGKLSFAAEIGLADTVIKLGAYFFHERMWNRISWGRPKSAMEYQI